MKKDDENKTEQLDFGLKEPISNKFYNVKNKFYYSQAFWKTQRFTKDTFIWLFIIFSLAAIIYQVYLLSIYFNQLPQNLPLLQMYLTPDLRLIPNELIILPPVISAVVLFISLPLSTRIYYENKLLGIFCMGSSTAVGFSLSYATVKLISFYI